MEMISIETEAMSDYGSYSDLLDRVYRDTPRRISHHLAIMFAGVTLKGYITVSGPSRGKRKYSKSRIEHYQESADTLNLCSRQIGKNTWLSTGARGLLEEFEDMPAFIRSATDLSEALFVYEEFDIEEILNVAETLNYKNGLRRLASMASSMNEWEHFNGYIDFPEKISVSSETDDWLPMRIRQNNLDSEERYIDPKYRVIWETAPEELFVDLLY